MDNQLRAEIQQELRRLATNAPVLTSRARTEKLYEIFILSCLARALRNIGATFEARDSSDTRTNSLVFRLGPGLIYSPTSAQGFILVSYNGNEYEIQNGLRVRGFSRVLHELDVCLIERESAQYCRANQVDPYQTKIKFMAECKFYGARLDLALGREYLGLSGEFRMRVKTIISNVGNDEIHQLVTKHRGTENFNVSPDNVAQMEIFVQWLANELRQVL